MEGMENGGGDDRRPTPVRAAMESVDEETTERVDSHRTFLDPKSQEGWVATISGRSTSGILPLRVIHLMEVNFSRAEAPETPLRRAIRPGESLDELDDDGLLALLRASSPVRVENRGTELGPSSRRDNRGRPRRGPRR